MKTPLLPVFLITFCAGFISIYGEINKKGHCPTLSREYRKELNCTINVEECSEDMDCPGTDKCCFSGCGFKCSAADQKPDIKAGDCPRLQPILSGPCKDTCEYDDDCPDIQKCCSNGCGNNCMKPGGMVSISQEPRKKDSKLYDLTDKRGNASVEFDLALVLPSKRSENDATVYKSGNLRTSNEVINKSINISDNGTTNTNYDNLQVNQTPDLKTDLAKALNIQINDRSRDSFVSPLLPFQTVKDNSGIVNQESLIVKKYEHSPQESNETTSSSKTTMIKTTSSPSPPTVTQSQNFTKINQFLYRVPFRRIKARKNNTNPVTNKAITLNKLTEKSDNISVSQTMFSNLHEFTVAPDFFPGTDVNVKTVFESSNSSDFYIEGVQNSSTSNQVKPNISVISRVNNEIFIKPGHCPTQQLGNIAICTEQCSIDKNCSGAMKCCSNGCGHECMEPLAFFEKPGQCPFLEPGKIGVCIHQCTSDSNCTGLLKCCSNGCGHQCMDSQEKMHKPGSCPKQNVTENSSKKYCMHLCDNDSHCSENLKCCQEGCSIKCVEPEIFGINKPGLCPPTQPGILGACVEMCLNDSECFGVQKCCSNGCGHVCRKPIEVKVNLGTCPIFSKRLHTGCFDRCFSDEDCGQVKKCCFNGCAKECQSPVLDLRASERDLAPQETTIKTDREKVEKHGFCYPVKVMNETKQCAALCVNDEQCNGTKKCCPSGCGFECQESSDVPVKEGECPRIPKEYVGSCFNYCRADENCQGALKCCSNGCGKLCLSPNKKFKKEGQCPLNMNSKQVYSPCYKLCENDEECMGQKKCCNEGCSTICKEPEVPDFKVGECPMVMPGESGTCKDECTVDVDCKGFLKCCRNECGSHSCRSPSLG